VLIDLGAETAAAPQDAAPVPDLLSGLAGGPQGQAMQVVASLGARRPNRVARVFWGAVGALIGFAVSIAAWNFVAGLLAANPALGWIAAGLTGLVLVTLIVLALREMAAFARLGRLDELRRAADHALATGDVVAARAVVARLVTIYRTRPELAEGRADLTRRRGDVVEADTLLALAEARLLAPLDAAARAEVETAARQVATVTALVPIALADVAVALSANIRMIRRIAELYGGRSGTLGAGRLTRAVLTHLVATGAVAIGDDMISSIAGGSVLSKISRRFGEGVVNGALTARVGVAAMEVCRPLPFGEGLRPSVTALVRRALTGLFGQAR
jgi:putative membrane protein